MIQIEKNLQELLRLKNLTLCSNTSQNFMRVNNDPNWKEFARIIKIEKLNSMF